MKRIYFTFFFLFVIVIGFAQNLNLVTQVNYPFPTGLSEIEENASYYFTSISNISNSPKSYYLYIDLIGDNGVSIFTDRSYKPSEPFIINGQTTEIYTFEEIYDYSDDFSSEYLVYEGTTEFQINILNTLPEGNYQICVYAYDYETELEIGTGCSITFPVGNENVPIINTPMQNEEVFENENSSFLISWEIPITNPGQLNNLEYELKLIDLTEAFDDDLEELFSDSGTSVVLESELSQNSYLYNFDGSDSELISGHEYGIRVRVLDTEGDLFFENNGYSEIRRFTYGLSSNDDEESDSTIVVTRELPEDCESRCNIVELGDTTIISDISNMDTLLIGYFKMIDMDLVQTGGMFSGTAKVIIDFMNDMKINVRVSKIKVNSSGYILSGSVTAIQDAAETFGDLAQYVNFGSPDDQLDNIIGHFPKTKYDPYLSYLNNARSLTALLGLNSTGLPIAINDSIKGNRFTIGLTDLIFRPNSAVAKIVVGTKLAIFDGENSLVLVADSVCIHPAGFGGEYNISLDENLVFPFQADDRFNLILKGNNGLDENYCKINFDCAGISSFDLVGEIHFPKNVIQAIDADTILDRKAKAYFNFNLSAGDTEAETENEVDSTSNDISSNHLNWIVEVTMDRFTINKLKGWTFELTEGFWDMSDVKNPKGIIFPEDYHTLTPDYRGFYIKEAIITPPKNLFSNIGTMETSEVSNATISDLFIDPNLYGKLEAVNILPLDKGRLDGWGLSIDSIYLEYYDNQLQIGRMAGMMQMPLLEETDTLSYKALIFDMNIGEEDVETTDSDETSQGPVEDLFYAFDVVVKDTVNFPFLLGSGSIYDDSYFDVAFYPSNSEQAYIQAVLHGELNIDSELHYPGGKPILPAAIKLPGMEYKLDYTSGENGGFNSDSTFISFASPQKSIGGFLVSLDDFDVNVSSIDNDVAVDFDIAVGVGKGGTSVQAASSFKLKSNFALANMGGASTFGQGMKTLKLDEIQFDSVSIGLDMEKFKMHGSLYWYNKPLNQNSSSNNSESARDKGVKGSLDIELPMAGIGGKFAAGFGTYGTPPQLIEGDVIDYDSTFYSYWFVDGALHFGGTGIVFSPGLAFYGIGGGVAYNMVRTDTLMKIDSAVVQNSSSFEPQYDAFNIKLLATLGTSPSPNAFNADISLSAQIVDGGIDMLSIKGDGYIATPITDRSSPTIWVDVALDMFLPNNDRALTMDGNLNVAMNLDSTLMGNYPDGSMDFQLVEGVFHSSEDSWYFYLGEPDMNPGIGDDPRGSAILKLGESLQVDMKTYMMVGHGVPTELPPLPPDIDRILNDPSGELSGTNAATENNGSLGKVDYSTGMGFAHGSYAALEADIDAKIIYAHLNAYLGYDMNLTQNLTQYCSNTGQLRGINGWYAQGQAYAGIEGDMGVRFKLFGREHDIQIMQLAAAIALTGGGPKPFYFGGRASIYYELLGGKIKGNSSFKFSVGERCSPLSENPFAIMPIFESIDPADSDINVFVGKNMSVKFAIPMDKPIYVPTPILDANNEIVRIEELSFTPKFFYEFTKNNGQAVFTQPIEWVDEDNHEQFFILPDQMLKPNKWYKLKITVKAMDNQTNNWLVDINTNKTWVKDTLITFKTGEYPESFEDFVSYNVPLSYERYYLQDISHAGRLYFTSGLNQNHYFPMSIPNSKFNFTYFVRFTNLENQENTEVPFTYVDYPGSAPQIRFAIPPLDNEAIYALQVIRKGGDSYSGSQINSKKGEKELVIANSSKADISTEITLTNDVIAPGKQTAGNEDLLYYTYFRTSKYNTLSEKVNAISINSTEYVGAGNNKKLKINLMLQEPFEKRDFREFHPQNSNIGNMLFEPKIKIRDPFNTVYHNALVKPKVAGFINNYNNNVQGNIINRNLPDDLLLDWGQYVNYWLPQNNFHSTLSEPLSESEVQNLWNNYLNTGSFNNASFSATTKLNDITVNIKNSMNAYIIYDTHFKVQKDKNKLKDWVLNYYASFCFPGTCKSFLDQHPSFDAKYIDMKNTDFKINSNPGNYSLSFYPNGSDKPGEYFPNFFKSVNINFSTPAMTISQSMLNQSYPLQKF